MRLLFQSDIQADESNLDLCEIAMDELVTQSASCDVDAVIFAGDLKEAYSPVPVNVVRFWIRAISRLARRRRVIVMLGNHDRVSQSRRSAHWLSVMRAAGAEIVSKPVIKKVGDGHVGFLPFTADKAKEKESANWLARSAPDGSKRVLVFHTILDGVVPVAKGITAEELCASAWDFCIGGDVHEHQRIKPNIWYTGSPFTHSWGEVNQPKGNLYLDTASKKPVQLQTKIPIWYDAEYLTGRDVDTKGCQIRSRVEVTSRKITQQIRDEEKRLAKLYPEARLFVVPRLVRAPQDDDVQLTGATDEERVGQYVAATLPEGVRFVSRAIVTYLTGILARCVEGAVGTRLDFVRATAKNVLSYEDVDVHYRKRGIVLLRGVRKDWNKRSNGAGKTNLLNMLPVGMFGQTLRGQKADAWAREDSDGIAEIRLVMRDQAGRKLVITRTRRQTPKNTISLERYKRDGTCEDLSEGMRGTGKSETQGIIEKATGFDLRMLRNSVYIDQTVANGFVFGTQKDRMDLVSKLQNLSRYEAALKIVTADIKKSVEALQTLTIASERLQEQIDQQTAVIEELQKEKKREATVWESKLAAAEKELAAAVQQKSALMGDEKMYKDYRTRISEWVGDKTLAEQKLARYRASVTSGKALLERAQKLIAAGKCYTCGQETSTIGTKLKRDSEAELKTARMRQDAVQGEVESLEEKIESKQKSLARWERELDRVQDEIEQMRKMVTELGDAAKEERTRRKELDRRIADHVEKLQKSKKQLKAAEAELREGDIHREMLEYAQSAVHRGGMPLYLASTLCEFLNKAGEEYSEIFTEGRIKIGFEVVDGEFQVGIVNPSGSDTSEGQSMGESAMAGIVAAFAVRDAAPKSNLLIIDEPGSNLDPEGCRQFARGLMKLKDRWETVIVTTHSPVIEGLLSGETTWTVRKTGKVSRLVT